MKSDHIRYSVIVHLTNTKTIMSENKRLYRRFNRTPTVRLRIISQIRFVIWTVFETVYDNAQSLKPASILGLYRKITL